MYPTRVLRIQQTRPLLRPMPGDEHSGKSLTHDDYDTTIAAGYTQRLPHTVSQRLRTLKKIPPELIPLGIVLGIAVGAAFYSMGKKLMSDKSLRLTKSNRADNFK
ncbi:hypothetical protein MMC16_002026 [Acarospora aff. strigata]|nr:hypothetical protein [Acarospora aff. strigata]